MDSHPLTDEILNIVGTYEKMRINREVPQPTLDKLKELNKDFAYIRYDGKAEFVEMIEIPKIRDEHDIRCWIGQLRNGNPVATIWHYTGQPIRLEIPKLADKVKAVNFHGNSMSLEQNNKSILIPVGGGRLTLIFSGISKNKAKDYLAYGNI